MARAREARPAAVREHCERPLRRSVVRLLGNLALFLLAARILAWIVVRIRDEETMLVAEFGGAYQTYQGRTERLIPFLY